MTPDEERAMRDELEALGRTVELARRAAVVMAWVMAAVLFVVSYAMAMAMHDGGGEWWARAVAGLGFIYGVLIGRDMPKKRR